LRRLLDLIASFVIALREGIEAALVVGIILGYLKKVGALDLQRPVYIGVGLGVMASIAVAGLFAFLALEFEGTTEQLFEGTTMFVAAAMLTTMIVWMHKNSRQYSSGLKERVQGALTKGQSYGLAALAFVSVFREGVETVLFLGSASFSSTGVQIIVGAGLGLALALIFGVAMMMYSIKLNLRTFFNVTGFLLIVFAAGLVAHGIHEFEEVGIVAPVVAHVWDVNWIVDDHSDFGRLLTALFGYNGNPSLVEVLGYLSYWLLIVAWIYRDSTVVFFRKAVAAVRAS